VVALREQGGELLLSVLRQFLVDLNLRRGRDGVLLVKVRLILAAGE
jgi:hypothetical protein